VLAAQLDATELYTPGAVRSVERSCAAQEVAEPRDGRQSERRASRSLTPALPEELVQLEAAPGVQASRPRVTLLREALPLSAPGQLEPRAKRSP